MSDRKGTVEKVEHSPKGVVLTLLFEDEAAAQLAQRIADNMTGCYAHVYDEGYLVAGIRMGGAGDGP